MRHGAAFQPGYDPFGAEGWLHRHEIGAGQVRATEAGLRLTTEDAMAGHYSNAQVDDTTGRPRARFAWRPPLTLRVRARFTHPAAQTGQTGLIGTAGFGFWNDFFMSGRAPTLPRAIWFFYASPPSDMRLDVKTPGHGWKAASIDALRPTAPLLLATAPAAIALMNLRGGYERIWPGYQRALRISEAELTAPMDEWHTYALEWRTDGARFCVDGAEVLKCAAAPAGPLGFVAWQDTQYLVATPQGRLRWGVLAAPGVQGMEIGEIGVNEG